MENYLVLTLGIDKEIQEYLLKGDTEELARALVRNYKNFVYLTAFRFVRDYDDAEDITQEVFIKAISKINSFDFRSSLRTWLYRITVNIAKNFLRKKRLVSWFRIDSYFGDDERFDLPERESENKLENKEIEELFLNAVASLPPKQREVFSLRYFDDLSYEEISKMTGITQGGLKANYFHAVRKIAETMKKYLEE